MKASGLKEIVSLIDAVVSLVIKIRDARKIKPCDHDIFLAHNFSDKEVKHENELFCPCGAQYQCLLCDSVFSPGDGAKFKREKK